MSTRTFGRRTQAARRYVIQRDAGICGICGHPGADTWGHKLPVSTHPQLEWNPDNWQAEHGTTRTLEADGFECVGNYGKGPTTLTPPPTRRW